MGFLRFRSESERLRFTGRIGTRFGPSVASAAKLIFIGERFGLDLDAPWPGEGEPRSDDGDPSSVGVERFKCELEASEQRTVDEEPRTGRRSGELELRASSGVGRAK